MSNRVTLEEVKQIVTELPLPDQLKLAADICERLSGVTVVEQEDEKIRQERLGQIDAWLVECDAVAESVEGEFDSAKDILEVREERANRL